LTTALDEMGTKSPLRAIILDLRGNPGGLITEATRVASLFLPPGVPMARVTDREHGPSVLRTAGPPRFVNTPLAVLVDGGSASGSEIVAGALKDAHRAQIIGDQTAGALGGAMLTPLPEGGMAVTVLRITTPTGAQVEGVGVAPDMLVALTEPDMERGEDTQLRAALQVLGAVPSVGFRKAA
jgi:carboxyl-terminal processing protease